MYTVKDKSSVTSNEFLKKINQENLSSNIKQSNKAENFLKNPITILNKTNLQINLLKNQSPKLSAGILRHKERNENLSLLDVDFNKISAGLKMPKQYERVDNINNNNDLYFNKTFNNAKVKNNYLSYLNALDKSKNIINDSNYNENIKKNNKEIHEAEEKDFQNSFIEAKGIRNRNFKDNNTNLEHKDSYKEKDLIRKTSSTAFKKLDNFGLEYFKVNAKTNNPIKINSNTNNNNNNSNKSNFRNDSEPKSLLVSLRNHGLEHKRLIKDFHIESSQNPHLMPKPKLISQQMQYSDVFFQKDMSFKENYKMNNNFEKYYSNFSASSNNSTAEKNSLNKTTNNFTNKISKNININNKYGDSDIFVLKNNISSISKIGEKHLLRETSSENIKNKFNITARSNSEWVPKNKILSLINHESTNYDFFNPQIKKRFYTKADLISLANGANPNKIQKCISEIIDLNRVGVPNFNKDYLTAYENDSAIFRKRGNIGESFYNLHKEYTNICNKPFAKKLI